MRTLTILALVTQKIRGAAACWLVSSVNCTVASILAVIPTSLQVTVWTSETWQTSAGRRACGRRYNENIVIVF